MIMEKILLIDDEVDVQYSFRRIFADSGVEILTSSSGEEGLVKIRSNKPDMVLMDVRMAGLSGLETLRKIRELDTKLPVIIMTAYGTTQTAIEAMKLGAYDYLLKPFDVPKLKSLIFSTLKASKAIQQTDAFQPLLENEDYEQGIIGRSEPMQEVFKLIGQVASSSATVMVTGESGTGKELVAKSLHKNGTRSAKPFIAINCAAIPETLLESELFGHEKGAFTGAYIQRIGRFEHCHGGTLFLDEVGDMPLATQAKILRIIQTGAFERVGGNTPVSVDVRIIAATNRALEVAVAKKEFREDLFYRLNVVRIHMPPLRERRSDIKLLVNFFIKRISQTQGQPPKSISEQALAALENHSWPGNVRELENVIHRAIVVATGNIILLPNLPAELHALAGLKPTGLDPRERQDTPSPFVDPTNLAQPPSLEHLSKQLFQWARTQKHLKILPAVERELVIQSLAETKGNQVQAAKLLGITRATLRKRIEKFGITQRLEVG